jgi:hypothetical protein
VNRRSDPTGVWHLHHAGRVLVALCSSLRPNFVAVTCTSSHVLSTRVCLGNRIGTEGAKALSDALRGDTTLASLSLSLGSK